MKLPDSLRALRHRDLQLFFSGQGVSLLGTWMQSVAMGWLVYRLWHSSELLGVVGFAGQIPVFLLGAWAGTVADHFPRRTLVLITQSVAALQATLLAVVTFSGHIQPWHLVALSLLLGLVYAFDIPSRQSYLVDMAGEDLGNAIALNSSLVNGARIIGPAIGGWVVAAVGEATCFLLNALSFIPVIYALWLTRTSSPRAEGKQRGKLMEGVRYAAGTPQVRTLLIMIGLASITASPYGVLMPVFAKDVFHGDAELQGRLLGFAGLGALIGAVSLLRFKGLEGMGRRTAWGATLFGLGLEGLALSPTVALADLSLVVTGAGFMTEMAGTNTLLQGMAPPGMRGRLMGLYSMMFIGMAPFGSLAMGELSHFLGPRIAVGSGATLLVIASIAFHMIVGRTRDATTQGAAVAGA